MAMTSTSSTFLTAAIGAFIVWRIVSRVRRMVGRQKYSKVRATMTVVIFPILIALILFGVHTHTDTVLGMLAGMGVGTGLGMYGHRLTKFENSAAGKFYTPNAHLGIALSLLLIGRLAWRMGTLYFTTQSFSAPPGDFSNSPLTLFLFGMLAAYYITFAIGLLRWARNVDTGLSPVAVNAELVENEMANK